MSLPPIHRRSDPIQSLEGPAAFAAFLCAPAPTSIEQLQLWEKLLNWSTDAKGAYARNTRINVEADLRIWGRFCQQYGFTALPTVSQAVRLFILSQIAYLPTSAFETDTEMLEDIENIASELIQYNVSKANKAKKMDSVKRYIASLNMIHHAIELDKPGDHIKVKTALKKAARVSDGEQRQMLPIEYEHIEKLKDISPSGNRQEQDILITMILEKSVEHNPAVICQHIFYSKLIV